jgi:hypothetical protein
MNEEQTERMLVALERIAIELEEVKAIQQCMLDCQKRSFATTESMFSGSRENK